MGPWSPGNRLRLLVRKREKEPGDRVEIRKLITDSLGPDFSDGVCTCGCKCGKSSRLENEYKDVQLDHIDKGRNNNQIVETVLRMNHAHSMCIICYTQHRWGKPLTDDFVEHMKRAFRHIKGWDRPVPPRREQGSQAFGIALEGEPTRYLILSHDGYRDLLGCSDTDQKNRKCHGSPRYVSCNNLGEEVRVSNVVNEFHIAILKGVSRIDKYVQNIAEGLDCSSCLGCRGMIDPGYFESGARHLSEVVNDGFINAGAVHNDGPIGRGFVKQAVERLTNPEWLRFHAADSESHPTGKLQLEGSGPSAQTHQGTKDYQLLADLRQRVQQSRDPAFINSFFEMAEELALFIGYTGSDPGTPIGSSYGGGPGAPMGTFYGGGAGPP